EDELLGEVLAGHRDRRALGQVGDLLDEAGCALGRVRRRGLQAAGRDQADAEQRQARAPAAPAGAGPGGRCRRRHHIPFGRATCSTTRPTQSIRRASRAVITAPVTSTRSSYRFTPVVISSPSPPPLMKLASAAVPTSSTSAVRTPASM